MSNASPSSAVHNRFPVRLAIGLVQGLVLYGLYYAHESGIWPGRTGTIFTPALAIALFVPLIAIQSYGNLRPRSLAKWVAAATIIIGALALYDNWRAWPEIWVTPTVETEAGGMRLDTENAAWQPQVLPSVSFLIFLAAAIFVAHALVRSSDADERFFAHYPTHFDIAWVQAIQLALSLTFVGVFWSLLFLGSALFKLLGLTFLETLIEKEWFWIPATALAAATAIHLTDASAILVRGARTLVLTLFSWLLPVLTLILAGFLGALAFTGLEPLWATQSATVLLILSATASLVLVNAVYQDGSEEHEVPLALRLAGTLAAVLMLPLTILAGYATSLRVGQYGWTADRVMAAAIIFAVAFYAIGYVIAALRPGQWMRTIERWNFAAALVVLAVFVAIFSPIADPQRIGVNSQMARLASGAVKPEDFDFVALRWDGGRFGKNALETLAADESPEQTKAAAAKALKMKRRYEGNSLGSDPNAFDGVAVYPEGQSIPESFTTQDWQSYTDFDLFHCTNATHACRIFLIDINRDGKNEVAVFSYVNSLPVIYEETSDGKWVNIGRWNAPGHCETLLSSLIAGQYSLVPPEMPTVPDLQVGKTRYIFLPRLETPPCSE
jgi:hypothetical protein